jgi:hypothetical protein
LAAYEQEADEAALVEEAEAEAAPLEPALEPALAAALAAEAEPEAEAEPMAEVEPMAATSEPEAATLAAEPEPAAAPAERRDDRVEIPTWRIVAPDDPLRASGGPPSPRRRSPRRTPSRCSRRNPGDRQRAAVASARSSPPRWPCRGAMGGISLESWKAGGNVSRA